MGIFNTILFAAAALAAVMTIFSTVRAHVTEFAALRVQLTDADTARLVTWGIVETQRGQQNFHPSFGSKVRSRASGPKSQEPWASASLPSLAA